jgi:glycosyltransferase involved in cell wall biosynthesis
LVILIVADASSIHTIKFANFLSESGFDVHVASFNFSVIKGVKVHLLRKFNLGKFGYFLALYYLPKIFKKIKPDIVHAHYLTSYGFLSSLSRLRPLVVTAWGSDILVSPQKSLILKFFVKFCLKNSDVATVVAKHMKNHLVNFDINVDQVNVTPFGIDTNLFKPDETFKNLKLIRIVSTRALYDIYDVQTLLFAIKRTQSLNFRFHLDIVGSGPLRSFLEGVLASSNMNGVVQFHGQLDQINLSNILKAADIYVSTSLSDGNSSSLFEAMSSGCFPVVSKIPANIEWIEHGVNGYLFNPGQEQELSEFLVSISNNSELLAGAKAINRRLALENFDSLICYKRFLDAYFLVTKGIKSVTLFGK